MILARGNGAVIYQSVSSIAKSWRGSEAALSRCVLVAAAASVFDGIYYNQRE